MRQLIELSRFGFLLAMSVVGCAAALGSEQLSTVFQILSISLFILFVVPLSFLRQSGRIEVPERLFERVLGYAATVALLVILTNFPYAQIFFQPNSWMNVASSAAVFFYLCVSMRTYFRYLNRR